MRDAGSSFKLIILRQYKKGFLINSGLLVLGLLLSSLSGAVTDPTTQKKNSAINTELQLVCADKSNDKLKKSCDLPQLHALGDSTTEVKPSFLDGLGSIFSVNPWVMAGAAVGAGAAAAGGGGGGGGGGGSSTTTTTTTNNDPTFGAPAGTEPVQSAYYQTSEYLRRPDLDVIKAKEAYANIAGLAQSQTSSTDSRSGQAGDGVIIAILDTGVDQNHSDLTANIKKDCASDIDCNNHYASADSHGHGTHVAGIAAASKNGAGMHGVAFNATILPGCADLNNGCNQGAVGDAELMKWAADNGAKVANMSYGYSTGTRTLVASDRIDAGLGYDTPALKNYLFQAVGTTEYNSAKSALEQGLITVLAAGNHYSWVTDAEIEQPSVMAVAPLIYQNTDIADDLAYQWLTVINVDNSGQRASTTHACGDAAEFCLAAPGENIYSTTTGGSYGNSSGTSMAAPQVSGAIALVAAAFPTLTLPDGHAQGSKCDSGSGDYNPAQCHSKAVVNRLLVSATDLGDAGVDAVYGRGLLNLDQATRILGEPQLASANGALYSLNGGALNSSSALGANIAEQLAQVQFVAVDSYDNAGFLFNGEALLGQQGRSQPKIDSLDYLNRSMNSRALATTVVSPVMSLSYRPAESSAEPDAAGYQFNYAVTSDSSLQFGYGMADQMVFASPFAPNQSLSSLVVSQAFAHPLNHFNQEAYSVGYQYALSSNTALNFSIQQGQVSDQFMAGYRDDEREATSMVLGLSGKLTPTLDASVQFGHLREDNSLLGAAGTGIWNLDNGSETVMAGINLDYHLSPEVDLVFSYYRLNSRVQQSQGPLQFNGDIESDSISVGLLGQAERGFSYGFFVTQPFSVSTGRASLELPQGYNGYELSYGQVDLDLSGSGRHLEYEFALGWEDETSPLFSKLNLIRVEDYGNIAGLDDTLLLMSLGTHF